MGICLDTCHIFAAGYDIRSKELYEKTIQYFNETIGLQYLKLIHLNDSKKDLGSRVDRHYKTICRINTILNYAIFCGRILDSLLLRLLILKSI